jgi:hypothetical protein
MRRTLILLMALLVPGTGFAASPTSDSPPAPPQSPRRPPLLFITTPSGAAPAPAQQAAPAPGNTVGYTPAPVPNIDAMPPSGQQHVGPELSGSLVPLHAADGVADGYMHGSQYSSSLERHARPGVAGALSPTVNLKIPLQYTPQPLR